MKNSKAKNILGCVVLSIGSSHAAITVTTTYTDVAGAAPVVSNTDLAQTQFGSSSSGSNTANTDALSSARHIELFNGTIGVAGAQDTNATDWLRADVDEFVTIIFDTSVNTLGYDITGIDTIFGWAEAGGGRSNHGFQVDIGFVGGGSATLLTGENWAPNPDSEFWSVVSVTNDGGGALNSDTVNNNGAGPVADTSVVATGVESITLTITNGANPSVAAEFDIFGVATVPEPSSTALLGLGGLALVLRRRRS